MENNHKSVLITGATSGIGLATAECLFSNGNRVVLTGRNEEKLKEISAKLGNSTYYTLDLEDTNRIHELFEYLLSNNIKLDGMVHAAGYAVNMPVRLYSIEHMKKQMDIHYYAFVELCKCYYNKKISNEWSSVVALSSIATLTKNKGSVLYASSKSALNTAVSVISKEYIKRHIRVNAIMPAYVDTRMNYGLEDLIDVDERQPWGLIQPQAIADLIEFLLSDKSKYITGSLIPVSAGMDY